MSVATPTVLPRSLVFPTLLPRPPQPYPTPLQKHVQRSGRLNSRRDLQREMDDLSDEENQLDDLNAEVRDRGYNFLIPIGRTFTQHEEKNDADEASDESDDDDSRDSDDDGPSIMDEGENDSEEEDLDADMEDMDDEGGNITAETADLDADESVRASSVYEEDDADEDGDEEPPSDL